MTQLQNIKTHYPKARPLDKLMNEKYYRNDYATLAIWSLSTNST